MPPASDAEPLPPLPAWQLWLGALGIWGAEVCVSFGQLRLMAAAPSSTDVSPLWLRILVSALLWVPLTVACVRLVERAPVRRTSWAAPLAVHALALAAVVLGRAAFVQATQGALGWYPQRPSWGPLLVTSALNNALPYLLMTAGAHALRLARVAAARTSREAQLQAQLAEARMAALSAQLQPHFLFNALNALSALVHRDPDAAERLLARLGDVLRRSLDAAARPEVALREEVEALGPYLDIESARFGARLRVDWDVAPEVLEARVPFLVLQPLVENAIRHGVAPRAGGGRVTVAARADGQGALRLQVDDDGPGPAPVVRQGAVGLGNLRARLDALYGAAAGVRLSSREPAGARAEVWLPLRRGA